MALDRLIGVDDLIDKVRHYNPKTDETLIRDAYAYGARMHEGILSLMQMPRGAAACGGELWNEADDVTLLAPPRALSGRLGGCEWVMNSSGGTATKHDNTARVEHDEQRQCALVQAAHRDWVFERRPAPWEQSSASRRLDECACRWP